MRIAFLVNRFPMLSEQFILNQITGLLDRGHDVEIFATLPGNSAALHADVRRYRLLDRTRYRFQRPGHRVRRILTGAAIVRQHDGEHRRALLRALNVRRHGRPALSLDLLFAAAHLLDRPPFDIVHAHFGQAGLFAVRLRQLGVPTGKLVTTFYGCDVSKYLRTHGADAYRPLIRHGDGFICITEDMRARLVACGFPRERIAHVAVGIDLSLFTPRLRRLRPGEPVRLLTVGRLVEKKGFETSIRAVAAVVRSHPNLTYRIVGDGPLRGALEQLVAELGLERWVEFAGWKTQQEVRGYFDTSHVFVLASRTARDGDEEGLPGVLKEAQAMGLPVVSTWHGGIPECVLDGESGFLVPEGDVGALGNRLRYLVDHPERWPAMGATGRLLMEQRADMNRLNDELVQVYRGFVAPPPLPSDVGAGSGQTGRADFRLVPGR